MGSFDWGDLLKTVLQSFDVISPFVTGLIDAFIWLFHTALLKPLVQELIGNFTINENMLHENSYEIVGLVLTYCYQKMIVVGLCIILLIAMWQLFKSFFSYFGQTQTEEGWKIGGKLIVYGALALNAKKVCEVVIKMAVGIMEGISNITVGGSSVVMGTNTAILNHASNISGYVDQSFSNTVVSTIKEVITKIYYVLENADFSGSVSVSKLLQFVLIILIDVKLLKLAIDMAEKYMNVVLMIIISPIAFACGVARNTSKIFSKWVSLFISGILYQLLQFTLITILYYIVNNAGDTNIFKVLLLIWSVLSMGENVVSIVDELGFSSLGQSATGFGKTMGALNSINVLGIGNSGTNGGAGIGGGSYDGGGYDEGEDSGGLPINVGVMD